MGEVVGIGQLNLNAKAEQSRFALLVGTSQPAISAHVKRGVLSRGETYGVWLAEYCEQMRKEASGRSGEKQEQLTEARINESRENAAAKQQTRLREARKLLLRDDVLILLTELPGLTKTEILNTGEKILETLRAKHGIEIDDDDILEPLRIALGHIGDRAGKLRESVAADPE